MNSFPQRLAEIMRLADVQNVSQFAEALGYDRSERVRKVMAGESMPSFGMLEDIARTFVWANLHWLITGHGSPQLTEMPLPKHAPIEVVSRAEFEELKAFVTNMVAVRKRTSPVVLAASANSDGGSNKS